MKKTVSHKGRCTKGWKGSKVAEQASLMKTAWAFWLLYEKQTMLNKLMLWLKRTDGLLSLI